MDDIVQDFAEHMEVDFLHMNIEDEVHTRSLQDGLYSIHRRGKNRPVHRGGTAFFALGRRRINPAPEF